MGLPRVPSKRHRRIILLGHGPPMGIPWFVCGMRLFDTCLRIFGRVEYSGVSCYVLRHYPGIGLDVRRVSSPRGSR